MPRRIFPHQALRLSLLLSAFLLALLLSEASSLNKITSRAQDLSEKEVRSVDPGRHSIRASTALMNLPLSFEATNAANEFIVRGRGYELLLKPLQATIVANQKLLRMKLVGANESATAEALDRQPGKRNYLIGNNE